MSPTLDCLTVRARYVDINCNWFAILGDGDRTSIEFGCSGGTKENGTVRNCIISDFDNAITFPSDMITTGSPQIIDRMNFDFNMINDIIKCAISNIKIGIIPSKIGEPTFAIGVAAKSAIIIAITNSKGWSCPSSLFPIILTTTKTKKYKISVLILTINKLSP